MGALALTGLSGLATSGAGGGAPPPPTGFSAAEPTTDSLTLFWDNPGGAAVQVVASDAEGVIGAEIYSGTGVTTAATGLMSDQTYYFAIRFTDPESAYAFTSGTTNAVAPNLSEAGITSVDGEGSGWGQRIYFSFDVNVRYNSEVPITITSPGGLSQVLTYFSGDGTGAIFFACDQLFQEQAWSFTLAGGAFFGATGTPTNAVSEPVLLANSGSFNLPAVGVVTLSPVWEDQYDPGPALTGEGSITYTGSEPPDGFTRHAEFRSGYGATPDSAPATLIDGAVGGFAFTGFYVDTPQVQYRAAIDAPYGTCPGPWVSAAGTIDSYDPIECSPGFGAWTLNGSFPLPSGASVYNGAPAISAADIVYGGGPTHTNAPGDPYPWFLYLGLRNSAQATDGTPAVFEFIENGTLTPASPISVTAAYPDDLAIILTPRRTVFDQISVIADYVGDTQTLADLYITPKVPAVSSVTMTGSGETFGIDWTSSVNSADPGSAVELSDTSSGDPPLYYTNPTVASGGGGSASWGFELTPGPGDGGAIATGRGITANIAGTDTEPGFGFYGTDAPNVPALTVNDFECANDSSSAPEPTILGVEHSGGILTVTFSENMFNASGTGGWSVFLYGNATYSDGSGTNVWTLALSGLTPGAVLIYDRSFGSVRSSDYNVIMLSQEFPITFV